MNTSEILIYQNPNGHIKIDVSEEGSHSESRIRFSVADTGSGIPESEIPRIF